MSRSPQERTTVADTQRPESTPSPLPRLDWALIASLAAWIAMSVAACVYVARYASPIPFMDDMELVRVLVQDAPATEASPSSRVDWSAVDAGYLWSQANEHRIVIPRLVYLALLEGTHDFRSAMYFQVAVQSLLALALILFARRLRGSASFADAFFPLLLLHWGNAENFLLGMQITIAVPTALTSAFVVLALGRTGPPSTRSAVGMVLCLLLLPLNGGFGLMQMPPLLLWIAGAAWVLLRARGGAGRASSVSAPEGMGRAAVATSREGADRAAPAISPRGAGGAAAVRSRENAGETGFATPCESRRVGVVFAAGTVLVFALIAVYFVGFQFPSTQQRTHELVAIARTAAQFLSLNLGPIAAVHPWIAGIAAIGFALFALVFALGAWPEPRQRWRITGVLAGLAAAATIAVAIGIARGPSSDDAGLANRYVILPTPLFVSAFLALCVFGPRRLASAAQGLACLALLVLLPTDFRYGAWYGGRHQGSANALTASVRDGFPLEDVVTQNWAAFYPSKEGFRDVLLGLRASRMPPFEDVERGSSWPAADPYFMFEPRPRRVDAAAGGQPRRVFDESAYVLRADSDIVLVPPRDAREVVAHFGLLPNAWKASYGVDDRTDGVRFVVELRAPDAQPVVLFERRLEPRDRIEDRGRQSLRVELPPAPPGGREREVVLRLLNVSGAHREFDWGFWSGVRVR